LPVKRFFAFCGKARLVRQVAYRCYWRFKISLLVSPTPSHLQDITRMSDAHIIVEERIYRLQPGKQKDYLSLYEAKGRAVQLKHLQANVGYYTTETGPLNTIVHMWAYTSFNERETRRNAMNADPAWQAYVGEMRPLLVEMESRILKPAPFWMAWVKEQLKPWL
jgi:hypothetical protein